MNAVYKDVIGSLDKEKAAQLNKDEHDWLLYRDDMAAAYPAFNSGKQVSQPESTSDYWIEKASLTQSRIEFLHVWTGKDVPPGITGEYRDSYNGTLELEETADGIKFSFLVNRGSSHHVGDISGIAWSKGGTWYFKEDIDPTLKVPPCELTFTLAEGHIVRVLQKTPDSDAGSGVSYSGDYYKTGNLKKP